MSHEGIRVSSQEELARDAAAESPLSREALTPKKVRVMISEGKGLEIEWADGHFSAWNFAWLRHACPCAT
ncbi:MAG: gamma-butyrobetaine hydroxylase-like domain-containing protein, partial [Terracidiphilus sp.]